MPIDLPLPGADLRLHSAWLDPDSADALLDRLLHGVRWENHPARLFGREHPAPRLSCWIGDPGVRYRYSGVERVPHGWPPELLALRTRLAAELGVDFNSVLANLYRSGDDAMGWHSDDEPELGPRPTIASVSVGAPRRFLIRQRRGDARLALELAHGSLLVMAGPTQANTRHSLPRTRRPVGPRVNLTFRRVAPDPDQR